jgi:hypothetical protein
MMYEHKALGASQAAENRLIAVLVAQSNLVTGNLRLVIPLPIW